MLEIQPLLHELAKWRVKFSIDKYVGDWTPEQIANGEAEYAKYERYESEGNLLMNGGVSCLWQALIGNGTGTARQTLTYFNNGNAAIGVGDNNTAAAATQNDLQASTNKLRKAMDASNPAHTDGTTSGSQSIQFKSTFGTSGCELGVRKNGPCSTARPRPPGACSTARCSMGTKPASPRGSRLSQSRLA